MTRRTPTPVEFICVIRDHVAIGKGLPDGFGTLTTESGRWAYCTAGLHNVWHEWKRITGAPLDSIHHADVERLVAD